MISLTPRLLVAAIAGVLLLAGCADNDDDRAGLADTEDVPSVSLGAESPALSAPAPAVRAPQQAPKLEQQSAQRKEVTTGSVRVIANDPVAAARAMVGAVAGLGGRVDSRTEQPEPPQQERPRPLPTQSSAPVQGPRATLAVRVPADKTDRLLTELRSAGRVASVTINKNDVTLKSEDTDARIRALQTSVERLRALIVNAANVADLISAENALSSRQAELDGLLAQKRKLDDQVALSTITINFSQDQRYAAEEREDDSFWDGLKSGWNSLRDAIGDAVVAVGTALPWLGFFAVIGAVLWWVLRKVVRRKRKGGKSAEGAAAPAESATKKDPEPTDEKPAASTKDQDPASTASPAAKPVPAKDPLDEPESGTSTAE